MAWAFRNRSRIAKRKEARAVQYERIMKFGNPYHDALGRFTSSGSAKMKVDVALTANTQATHEQAAEGHQKVYEAVSGLNEKLAWAHKTAARYHRNAATAHALNSSGKDIASTAAREMSRRAFEEHAKHRSKWNDIHRHLSKVHFGDPLFGF